MNDNEMIKDCIQLYFDGCYESDPEKIKASFNPNASITGYLPDGFHEMSVDDFAGFVASQQPSPMENDDEKMLEILSCEVYGNTAAVKVREAYLGMIFIDCLSFLKKNDEWKIENISITMRTPGNDKDLIKGFLFNERIIKNINDGKNLIKGF